MAFTLSVTDVDGLDCAEPRQGRFNILPDERPRLFVLEPGRDAVATPAIRVPVRVRGDATITASPASCWLRGHNRSIERPFNMKLALKNGPQSVEAAGAFDFAQLGVRPGDVIEYYFEAADNYPKGPNLALSRLYRLEIISKEQYEAVLRQAAARKALFEPYFKLDGWLRRLAERARTASATANTNQAAAPELGKDLEQELAQYAEELAKLLETSKLFDIEESFRRTCAASSSRSSGRQRMKDAVKQGAGPSKEELASWRRTVRVARREQEEVSEPARELATVVAILAQADVFVKFAQEQAELAQLLRRFDKTGPLSRLEEMELQELAGRQQRIGKACTRSAQLPALLKELPADAAYDGLRERGGLSRRRGTPQDSSGPGESRPAPGQARRQARLRARPAGRGENGRCSPWNNGMPGDGQSA